VGRSRCQYMIMGYPRVAWCPQGLWISPDRQPINQLCCDARPICNLGMASWYPFCTTVARSVCLTYQVCVCVPAWRCSLQGSLEHSSQVNRLDDSKGKSRFGDVVEMIPITLAYDPFLQTKFDGASFGFAMVHSLFRLRYRSCLPQSHSVR
jgi:hypothetical protein